MEIEVGGVYRTRGGKKVHITSSNDHPVWPLKGVLFGDGRSDHSDWTIGGHYYGETTVSKNDLIAPWEDNPVNQPNPVRQEREADAVFQPCHYTRLYPEPITVINAWGLNFNLGSAVKYISRNGHKDGNTAEQDLSKAKRFIEIELERLRREKAIESGEATRSLLVETL